MKYNVVEAVIGALVLTVSAGFLVFAHGILYKKDVSGYQLQANFTRVDGLHVGSDVKISGVRVGQISKIVLDSKDYLAKVFFTLNVKLPVDSSAEIISEGLLGGKYLSISPGGEDDLLQANQKISYTQPSVSLEGLIGKFLFSAQPKEETPKEAPSSEVPGVVASTS